MSDREDIIQLINLYGFAMDTQRWDLFDRIFTGDCDADYGVTSHWTDRAQFKADFARVLAATDQLFLLDVYAASEAPVPGGTSADVLVALRARPEAPRAELLSDVVAAPQRIAAEIRDGDLLLFVGAGDIDAVARRTAGLLAAPAERGALMRSLRDRLSPETVMRFHEPLGPKTTMQAHRKSEM